MWHFSKWITTRIRY